MGCQPDSRAGMSIPVRLTAARDSSNLQSTIQDEQGSSTEEEIGDLLSEEHT